MSGPTSLESLQRELRASRRRGPRASAAPGAQEMPETTVLPAHPERRASEASPKSKDGPTPGRLSAPRPSTPGSLRSPCAQGERSALTAALDGPAVQLDVAAAQLDVAAAQLDVAAAQLDVAAAQLDVAAALAEVRAASPRLHASLCGLDAAQLAAILSDDPAAIVRAQVGSGKTCVLVHKVLHLHLVRGVPLEEIAVLTFTNRAADELHARLAELAPRPIAPGARWLMGTFHGVARALLQRALPVEQLGYRPDFAVLDEDARDALLIDVARRHKLRLGSQHSLHARLRVLADGGPVRDDLVRLAALAAAEKRARGVMDFDDLIDHAATLLQTTAELPPLRWVVVDELQDCEPRELRLLRRLRGARARFFAVGDPLQSIYGWRGGAPRLSAQLAEELGARAHDLPVSYRSTRTILDGARAVLGDQAIAGGALHAARGPGARIVVRRHHDPIGEASYLAARLAALRAGGVPYRDIAVLCRLRAQVETLAAMLAAHGTPCTGVDDDARDDGNVDAVRLSTLHAAKGLEFRHVFIAGANLGIVPLVLRGDPGDVSEERRLLFVGITRARDEVEISWHACPHQFGALGAPSPLLHLLPAAVVDWQGEPSPWQVAATGPAPSPSPALVAVSGSVELAAPVDAPWHIGQPVRHARYGPGVVVRVAATTVDCDFGKRGARSFPLRLCPLEATP